MNNITAALCVLYTGVVAPGLVLLGAWLCERSRRARMAAGEPPGRAFWHNPGTAEWAVAWGRDQVVAEARRLRRGIVTQTASQIIAACLWGAFVVCVGEMGGAQDRYLANLPKQNDTERPFITVPSQDAAALSAEAEKTKLAAAVLGADAEKAELAADALSADEKKAIQNAHAEELAAASGDERQKVWQRANVLGDEASKARGRAWDLGARAEKAKEYAAALSAEAERIKAEKTKEVDFAILTGFISFLWVVSAIANAIAVRRAKRQRMAFYAFWRLGGTPLQAEIDHVGKVWQGASFCGLMLSAFLLMWPVGWLPLAVWNGRLGRICEGWGRRIGSGPLMAAGERARKSWRICALASGMLMLSLTTMLFRSPSPLFPLLMSGGLLLFAVYATVHLSQALSLAARELTTTGDGSAAQPSAVAVTGQPAESQLQQITPR